MSEIEKTISKKNDLREIASLFFKLGCIAFGGPAAHIAMMENEIVAKRKWMTQEHFLDLIGATNLIPGPNSTEMTMHCGHEKAGWKGLFVAGICFIFPAALITGVFAWLYQKYGQLPNVTPFIYGIKPAVISIILMAAYKLSKKAIKTPQLALLCILSILACLLGLNEIIVLFIVAFVGILLFFSKKYKNHFNSFIPLFLIEFGTEAKISTLTIFLAFFKIGAILYGSGYVLFAFLESELVVNGWLTKQALLDAVAVGQITPGPILTTATFIGWQMNGFIGAFAATLGIFLPSFLFVLMLNPLIPKMRKSKVISNILDTVNVAAVALIIAVCIEMAKNTITDWRTTLISVISVLIVFILRKLNSAFIVLGSSILGYLLTFI